MLVRNSRIPLSGAQLGAGVGGRTGLHPRIVTVVSYCFSAVSRHLAAVKAKLSPVKTITAPGEIDAESVSAGLLYAYVCPKKSDKQKTFVCFISPTLDYNLGNMKKKNMTNQQEVASRKVKIPGNFVWGLYGLLASLPFFAPKYHPTYEIIDSPKDCKGPCFIIWNHQSRRDYLFIRKTAGRKFSMVAGELEFYRSHLAWLFKQVRNIPKKPFFDNDLPAIANMNRIIKAGGAIAMSPEGTSSIFGDNQPITPGTARFIRHYKIPVYCVDLRGSYLSSNKIDINDRIGKVEAKMYLLFTPEQLATMTDQEVEDKINEVFHHDDYEWNKKMHIRYKNKNNICSHLHDMAYKCPRCGHEFEMEAGGNRIVCKHCGNGATMDDYYDFHPFDDTCIIPSTPSKWTHYERQEIIKEIRKDDKYCMSLDTTIGGTPTDHLLKDHKLCEIEGEGKFYVDHEGVHFVGTRHGKPYEMHLSYKEVYTPCVEDDLQDLTFYPKGETTTFRVGKYGGKFIMLIQEMHRLHENRWKNFKWFDYMYENLDEPSRIE